jgi:hypothetical protein
MRVCYLSSALMLILSGMSLLPRGFLYPLSSCSFAYLLPDMSLFNIVFYFLCACIMLHVFANCYFRLHECTLCRGIVYVLYALLIALAYSPRLASD